LRADERALMQHPLQVCLDFADSLKGVLIFPLNYKK
jgi:hypothetical protein